MKWCNHANLTKFCCFSLLSRMLDYTRYITYIYNIIIYLKFDLCLIKLISLFKFHFIDLKHGSLTLHRDQNKLHRYC